MRVWIEDVGFQVWWANPYPFASKPAHAPVSQALRVTSGFYVLVVALTHKGALK